MEKSDIANKLTDHFASMSTNSNHLIPNSSGSLSPKMMDIHLGKPGARALVSAFAGEACIPFA